MVLAESGRLRVEIALGKGEVVCLEWTKAIGRSR